MFPLLGNTVTRLWPLLLGAWLLLLVVGWRLAPAWEEVTQGGDVSFLPGDSPSRRGQELFKKAFPDEYADSSVVLVVSREEDATGLRDQDKKFIAQILTPALKKMAEEEGSPAAQDAGSGAGVAGGDIPSEGNRPASTALGQPVIARIRAPEDPGVGALLLSRDKRAALVLVELTTPFLDRRNWATVEKIEGLVATLRREKAVPPGLEIAITGSATAGRDVGRAELKSAHDVEVWTIVVVVALLLLTYRAPLVALIPLATVYVAVQVALQLLALLAQAQALTPSRDLRIFITVLAYGAGVDYCVFLIARYREELDAGADVREALARAIGRAGGPVTASAATVICGIGMLAFARFGKIREAGLVIPFSLVLVLGAALTFAPALLRWAGRWVFWPQGLTERATAGHDRGRPTRFPGRLLRRNLLPDVWDRIGPALLRRPGLIWFTAVAVMTPFAVVAVLWYREVNYDPLSGLPESAPSVAGARALERHFSPGVLGPVTVLLQNDQVDFGSEQGIGLIRELTERLEAERSSLGIADLRSVARPLGTSEAAQEALPRLPLPRRMVEWVMRKRAIAYYVSHAGELNGHVTRVDLVLAVHPLSLRGIEYLDRIERSLEGELPQGLRRGTQLSFTGRAGPAGQRGRPARAA
jgi:RND superfamily putative drug exporter